MKLEGMSGVIAGVTGGDAVKAAEMDSASAVFGEGGFSTCGVIVEGKYLIRR